MWGRDLPLFDHVIDRIFRAGIMDSAGCSHILSTGSFLDFVLVCTNGTHSAQHWLMKQIDDVLRQIVCLITAMNLFLWFARVDSLKNTQAPVQ